MARDGFRIFDTDTHVGPSMEVLEKHLTQAERTKLPSWDEYKVTKNPKGNDRYEGTTTYKRGVRHYRRVLGTVGEAQKLKGYMAGKTATKGSIRRPVAVLDGNPAERIKDMDLEGVDVGLMLPSGWFGTWTAGDAALESGIYRAYHRWQHDYCGAFPDRLGGVLLVSGRDIPGSLEEINHWGKSRWPWAILPYAPYGMPLDHPDFEPVWAAAQEHDLAIALHTFTAMPPYAPGGMDTWENLFLQRSAAHPWCGMRNMASLIGGGVLDRYPRLRIGTLEAGHGWLPSWLARIDEHAESCKAVIADIKMLPSEYVAAGRYFQSVEIHEGEGITNGVCELLGDDVLMYGSDYPHGESRFPESTNIVMGWKMPDERRRKMLWDNPVKFYARSGHK